MKYDYIIAIDPDTDKSGVAFLETATRKIEVSSLTFPLLMDYLQFAKSEEEKVKFLEGFTHKGNKKVVVVVEAGWLNSISNYHTSADRRGQRIAKNVGSNHETGRKIVEMAKHYGFEVIEQAPFKKCWKGKNGKITSGEIRQITGLIESTNQDMRDAVLLAWLFADFPIRLKVC